MDKIFQTHMEEKNLSNDLEEKKSVAFGREVALAFSLREETSNTKHQYIFNHTYNHRLDRYTLRNTDTKHNFTNLMWPVDNEGSKTAEWSSDLVCKKESEPFDQAKDMS